MLDMSVIVSYSAGTTLWMETDASNSLTQPYVKLPFLHQMGHSIFRIPVVLKASGNMLEYNVWAPPQNY